MPSDSLPPELLELIVRTSRDGIVITDEDGDLVFVNPAAAMFFGYAAEELVGQPLAILLPPELRRDHGSRIASLVNKETSDLSWQGMDIPGVHRSGRRIPLEISFAESRNGSGVFFVGFLRDLSERHWGHSRLAAQYAVAELLSTADDEQIALREILTCIGEHLGFATGNLWLVEQDRLVWSAAWHALETATASFTDASRQRTFTAGEGLPGRVWAQEVPAWIATIAQDENFPRADAALAVGLRSGLGFRVRRGAHIVGVIEYFSNSVRPLEPTLLQILNAVGHQISQFLERKHAQDSLRATEAQYRMLFENSNDAFGVSVDERFVYVNQAFAAMFRYDCPEDVRGVLIYDTLPAVQHATVREHRKRRLAGLPEPMQYASRGRRRDGTEFPTEVRATDYWIGGSMYTLAILRDTTIERQAQEVLTKSNAALRRANEDLEQFAYAASHDLQEPLRMITLYSELLTRRYREALPPDAQQLLATITDAAHRINELVNDLLSYTNAASLEASSLPVTNTNLVLSDIHKSLHERIASTETVITSDTLAPLRVHRSHLFQLLQNLISNSIKYHTPGEVPRIHVGTIARPDGLIELSVQDNGIGIAPEYQERIFGIFKRLHTSSVPGTGIGLAICKRIAEFYGGMIGVESEAGKGARFYCTLPAGD